MSEPTYHLHPKAETEILDTKRMLTNSYKSGLITRAQAQASFIEETAKIILRARVESRDDRMINVTCPDCKREHRMRADVVEYRCRCDGNKVRFAMAEQSGTSRPVLNGQAE